MSTQAEALRLLALGFRPIPMIPGEKKSAAEKWKRWQTESPTAEEVRGWRWDGRNIAVVTGESARLLVLDCDDPPSLNGHSMPDTPTVVTSRGWHKWFRYPGGDIGFVDVGEKSHVLGNKHLAIVPPSVHHSGTVYAWAPGLALGEVEIAEPPQWLLERIEAKRKPTERETADPVGEEILDGARNVSLTRYAGILRHAGTAYEEILQALRVMSAGRCKPPLPESEIEAIAQSVAGYEPGQGDGLHDVGNGERLVTRYGRDLRYCHPWGKWLVWDSVRWAVDATDEVTRRAKETAQGIYHEAAEAKTAELAKNLGKWAASSMSQHRLSAMMWAASSEPTIPVLPADLDAEPYLLNLQNGTFDLRAGRLAEHQRTDLITKLAPVRFDPAAECPLWEAFLAKIMSGKDALIDFLRRAIGYSLTGDTSEQCLFILYGTGSNGKSTFLETIRALLGDDYALRTPTETLLVKRNMGIPNDVARLRGARLVTAIEAEEGRRLAESLVKDLTGGDTMSARFLHQEWFDFRPECKIWLATNHKPVIRGTDRAIWRRIRLIPFTVTIPDADQDRHLAEKLRGELPGILQWALLGCARWKMSGLGQPDEVKTATAAYRDEMDVLAGFLADRCVLGDKLEVKASALYRAFVAWCDDSGEKSASQRVFGERMTERGFDKYRANTGNVYMGVSLG